MIDSAQNTAGICRRYVDTRLLASCDGLTVASVGGPSERGCGADVEHYGRSPSAARTRLIVTNRRATVGMRSEPDIGRPDYDAVSVAGGSEAGICSGVAVHVACGGNPGGTQGRFLGSCR